MDDVIQKEIFKRNLLRYIGDTPQAEVAKAINVSAQTLNTWCKGKAIPRAGKLQTLADYFGIKKSDLIEEPTGMVDSKTRKFMNNYSQLQPCHQSLLIELIEALKEEPQDPDKVAIILGKIARALQDS